MEFKGHMQILQGNYSYSYVPIGNSDTSNYKKSYPSYTAYDYCTVEWCCSSREIWLRAKMESFSSLYWLLSFHLSQYRFPGGRIWMQKITTKFTPATAPTPQAPFGKTVLVLEPRNPKKWKHQLLRPQLHKSTHLLNPVSVPIREDSVLRPA